jgi:hypothetical protein
MTIYIAAAVNPCYLFFMKYSSDDAIDLEALMGATSEDVLNEMYEKIYKCPVLEKSIKSLLPFLNERGFLETKSEANEE